MSETPDDIMEAARVALIEAVTASRAKSADEGIRVIAAALMAERLAERQRFYDAELAETREADEGR